MRIWLTAAIVNAASLPPALTSEDGRMSNSRSTHPVNAATGEAGVTNQPPGPLKARRNESVLVPVFRKSSAIPVMPAEVKFPVHGTGVENQEFSARTAAAIRCDPQRVVAAAQRAGIRDDDGWIRIRDAAGPIVNSGKILDLIERHRRIHEGGKANG